MGKPARHSYYLVILAGAIILALSLGIRQALGLYLAPISEKLMIGKEAFSLSLGLMNLLWGMLAPFVGALADRYGPALIIFVGGMLYAAGLYCMSIAGDPSGLYLAGSLIGGGLAASGFTAILGTVGRAAPPEKRGLALTLATTGGSIGQFLALPYTQFFISNWGISNSLWALAVTISLILICAYAFKGQGQDLVQKENRTAKKQPEKKSYPGDSLYQDQAIKDLSQIEREAESASLKETLFTALSHPGFMMLTLGFCVCGFHVAFVAIHLPNFLSNEIGIQGYGASALMMIGLGNIFGTFLAGRVGDFVPKKYALSGFYTARSLVFLGFLFIPLNGTNVLILSGLLGLLWLGTVPLTSGLIGALFGAKWLSMLFGIVFFSHQIGSFAGAWLGGIIFDQLQSYQTMWWISVALGLLSALLHLPIREQLVRIKPA